MDPKAARGRPRRCCERRVPFGTSPLADRRASCPAPEEGPQALAGETVTTSPRIPRLLALLAVLGLGAVLGVNVQAPVGKPAAAAPWIGDEDLKSNLPASAAEERFDLAALMTERA